MFWGQPTCADVEWASRGRSEWRAQNPKRWLGTTYHFFSKEQGPVCLHVQRNFWKTPNKLLIVVASKEQCQVSGVGAGDLFFTCLREWGGGGEREGRGWRWGLSKGVWTRQHSRLLTFLLHINTSVEDQPIKQQVRSRSSRNGWKKWDERSTREQNLGQVSRRIEKKQVLLFH